MKRLISVLLGILFCSKGFCLSLIPTEKLLLSYIKRDIDLTKASLDFQRQVIQNEITTLQNGFSINLSTGSIRFTNIGTDNISISFSPSIEASIPQAANLDIYLKGDFGFQSKDFFSENISLSATVDILSSSQKERQIKKYESERSLLQAQRNLQEKALQSEKKFYNEIRNLINSIDSIVKKKNELYEEQIELEKVKLQGYSKTSVTYRRIEMSVLSLIHELESERHSLIYEYELFYKKCGEDLQIEDEILVTDLLPTDIFEVPLKEFSNFEKEKFKEIDNAKWNKKINELKRAANINYSLDANAGYTINNKNTNSNTVDFGVKGGFGGVEIGLGTNIPFMKDKSPSFSVSASVNPNTFKNNKLQDKIENISVQEDQIQLNNARINYGTSFAEKKNEFENLEWEKKSIEENLGLSISQEESLLNWFKQGVITESEYLSAKNNVQSYSIKLLLNYINRIIYNNELAQLFYE